VPDLTHDTAEDGFHEIQLSGKQLVFLFMVLTAASVVIFVCGVLVGRGIAAEAGAEEPVVTEEVAQTPAEAGAPASVPPTPVDDLRYHEDLQKSGPPKADLPAAEQKPAPEPPPVVQERAPEPAVVDVPTSGRPGIWHLQVGALKSQSAAADLVRQLAAKGYPAYLENPASGAPAIYRVRVGRYKSRAEAAEMAGQIKKDLQYDAIIGRE
jgi:cell division septation protein DedD